MGVIVYTRHKDGGVDVMRPAPRIFDILQSGGWWDDAPIGVRGFVERQIEIMTRDGVLPSAARRFASAVAFGGAVGHEAWDILRARCCEHLGRGFIKMSPADLPDRWFRNAWRQNSNGNITIDLGLARDIQKGRVTAAVNKMKAACASEVFAPRKPPRINHIELSKHIAAASSVDELRRVWPEGVPYA